MASEHNLMWPAGSFHSLYVALNRDTALDKLFNSTT